MQQSYMDVYGKYLMHKGVKGMKWGKRITPQNVKDVTESQKEFMFKTPGNIDPKIMESRKKTQEAIDKMNWDSQVELQGYPDEYVKQMDLVLKKAIKGGRVGYQDQNGMFFEGNDKKSVYKKKFENDMAISNANAKKAAERAKNKK